MVGLFVVGLSVLIFSSIACKKLNQQIMYSRARSFHDAGNIDKAIAIYQKLIEMEKDNSEVLYDLGVAYAQKNQMALARGQVKKLKSIGRKDLADVLESVIHSGDAKRVREQLQRQHERSKKDNDQ